MVEHSQPKLESVAIVPMMPFPPQVQQSDHVVVRPNLPQWVDHRAVDSPAMLSAFLQWHSYADLEEKEATADLFIIDHTMNTKVKNENGKKREVRQSSAGRPSKRCTKYQCLRCQTGRGGYQFRWFDQRWVEGYRSMRRERAWSPRRHGRGPFG